METKKNSRHFGEFRGKQTVTTARLFVYFVSLSKAVFWDRRRSSEQAYSLLLGVVSARWYLWLVVLNQGIAAIDYNTI